MQATVASFDPATYQGAVLLDDGVRLPLDPAAFAGSGLRHVRPGQRVHVVVRAGVVVAFSLTPIR